MEVRELTQEERQVLFGLLAHLVSADGRVDAGELEELDLLGDEMGTDALRHAVEEARATWPTRDAILAAAAEVRRADARELIRTLLIDLAGADGDRKDEEEALITQVLGVWDRS